MNALVCNFISWRKLSAAGHRGDIDDINIEAELGGEGLDEGLLPLLPPHLGEASMLPSIPHALSDVDVRAGDGGRGISMP
jgi:hypothetical protein